MSKRYYQSQPATDALALSTPSLPTDLPVGVYYRKSTDMQVGNISTSIQTIDMVAYLRNRGWSEDDIVLIDMDAGVSGTKKIDERPGMRQLFDLITQRKIGVVACQDENRLFRDVTQIQVNIFIEACRAANVLVLTPAMVYDFANELTGTFHARQFRFKCEMAAEYLNTVIKGKLERAKRRLLMEGRWAGFSVVPGFMVDCRKTLPDGSKNPNWRRYVPFPEFAEVVNEYFRLFLKYAGNVYATIRHIHEHGPYYPDPAICPPPDGFKFITRMKRYGHGYSPARHALQDLLTNATLIGHWSVNDIIVRWHNHPGIVPEDVFWQAFNYLSPLQLDGTANPHYRPFCEHARPSLEANRPVERPLCAGMLVSPYEDEWKSVGTTWIKENQEYIYVLAKNHPHEEILWRRSAKPIDNAVVRLLHEKLRATFAPDVWETTIAASHQLIEEDRRQLQTQLSTLERIMESHIVSLETLTEPDLIRAVEPRYKNAQAEHKRLSEELAATHTQAAHVQSLYALKAKCDPCLESWDSLTRDEQRTILYTFIHRIEATILGKVDLQLCICWIDASQDAVMVPVEMKNGGRHWLASETELLLSLVNQNASQVDIAARFPTRTWRTIRDKIAKHCGHGVYSPSPRPIRGNETFADYQSRIVHPTTEYMGFSGDQWTAEDTNRLRELVDEHATKLQLLESFPTRRWLSIAKKIVTLYGDIPLPHDKTIRRKDTWAMYRARHLGATPAHSEQLSVSSESGLSMVAPTPNSSPWPNF